MAIMSPVGRIPLPREHGGWAMMLVPPIVALVTFGPTVLGVLALVGWVAGYCLRGSVEALRGSGASGKAGMTRTTPEAARIGLLLFGGLAVACFGPVIILRPWTLALLLIDLVCLGALQVLADRGRARNLSSGVLASLALMVGGPLYYLASTGSVPAKGWALAITSAAFFAGSVFRVKTLARERRSLAFRVVSVAVHLGAFLVVAAAAWVQVFPWLVAVALLPAVVWAIYGAVRAGEPVRLSTIGQGEQWLTVAFGLLLIIALR